MRYVRFLKTPRITAEKGTTRSSVYCLINITSDLGDSTLPYDAALVAELISPERDFQGDEVLESRCVKWTADMRTLAVTLPLKQWHTKGPLRVRIGASPRAPFDTFSSLSDPDAPAIVSAWSAEFTPQKDAVKLAERRFQISPTRTIRVWEETGESIARHLWDAGITLSCHLRHLAPSAQESALSAALSLPSAASSSPTGILELGTGCGIVGMALAALLPNSRVTLTDLPEARDIVERNMACLATQLGNGSTLRFEELDWDADLPAWYARSQESVKTQLVLASDCTYNADSSPALVNTLRRLADANSSITVAIAMKMRHASERVFFELMRDAGFAETALLEWPLPGDVHLGEETVFLHVYRLAG